MKWLLESKCNLLDSVKEHWNITAEHRMTKLKRLLGTPDSIKTEDLFNTYPILLQPDAYQLIEIDFPYLQYTSNDVDEASWQEFFRIISSFSTVGRKYSNAKCLQDQLKGENINSGL